MEPVADAKRSPTTTASSLQEPTQADSTVPDSAPSEPQANRPISPNREKLLQAVVKRVRLAISPSLDFGVTSVIGRTSRGAMNKLADENIWIGGFHAINQTDAFEKANITHVVTVLRIEAPEKFAKYIHHLIQVDDVADEDLIQYFPKTNAFIAKALAAGGAVYVHCAMGISRSATILAAYLMHSRKISAEDAISVIKSVRPIICPNFGFREQLKLFEEMGCPDSVEDQPIYQRWLFKQDVELSNYVGKAPSNIRFEDELSPQGDGSEGAVVELRCKRCRQSLATSRTFAPHTARVDANGNANPQPCAHHFLEPLLWMKPELSKGAVSGKLECPKCESKVGSYAWQGLKCSCGSWVVPGISIARGKVDEVKVVSHL